jgi:hypothetical protein
VGERNLDIIKMHGTTIKIKEKGATVFTNLAPQNDICPHGRTYPMNAVAMFRIKITNPTVHVRTKLYDP